MNKVFVGILVIVVGGVAGWYVMKGYSSHQETLAPSPTVMPTPAENVQEASEATVSYTDSGFSPKTIRVRQGTAVTFMNTSSGTMWVITDMHPTHKLLPSFNEGKAVGTGGSYTYTFADVGTWLYHNEENITAIGSIIVE